MIHSTQPALTECYIISMMFIYHSYINIFLSPIAPPTVTNLTFNSTALTLTCTSTGSPATIVTWMKDGSPLTVDGTTYTLEQTVTGRSTSTYDNVLTISEGSGNIEGSYTCTVENILGSDSMTVQVRGKGVLYVHNFMCSFSTSSMKTLILHLMFVFEI